MIFVVSTLSIWKKYIEFLFFHFQYTHWVTNWNNYLYWRNALDNDLTYKIIIYTNRQIIHLTALKTTIETRLKSNYFVFFNCLQYVPVGMRRKDYQNLQSVHSS